MLKKTFRIVLLLLKTLDQRSNYTGLCRVQMSVRSSIIENTSLSACLCDRSATLNEILPLLREVSSSQQQFKPANSLHLLSKRLNEGENHTPSIPNYTSLASGVSKL